MQQEEDTIEQLQELGYDPFMDGNNVLKITDVYGKDETPCAILSNCVEKKT